MNTLERVDEVQPQLLEASDLENSETQDRHVQDLEVGSGRSPFGFTPAAERLNGRLAMVGFVILFTWAVLQAH